MKRDALAVLVIALCGARAARAGPEPTQAGKPPGARDRQGHAILLVMNKVVDRLIPRLIDEPRAESHRLSVKNGLIGLGAHRPQGGVGYGMKSPPLDLFPRAGLGTSLNVDPITGRSYLSSP